MGEPKARDIPERTVVENLLPEYGTQSTEYGRPGSRARISEEEALQSTARRVGSAMGEAAASVREVQEKLKVVPQRAGKLKQQITERSSEAVQRVSELTQEYWNGARERALRARRQMLERSQEKPFHAIAIAAGAAFALGIALRIWRNRG